MLQALVVLSLAAAPAGDITHGKQLFDARCGVCHSAGSDDCQGPGLAGVVGRKAAGGTFGGYTPALRSSGLTWTPTTLDKFLAGPASFVPGTAMVVSVPDAAERRDLIAYLATLVPTKPATPSAPQKAEAPHPAPQPGLRVGAAAFGDFRDDAPGVRRRFTAETMPAPFASTSSSNGPRVVPEAGQRQPSSAAGLSHHADRAWAEGAAPLARSAQRRRVHRRERRRPYSRAALRRGREPARARRGLRRRARPAVWHRLLSAGAESEVGLRRGEQRHRALRVPGRRRHCAQPARDGRRAAPVQQRRPLDARRGLLQRRQAHVRLGGLGVQRGERACRRRRRAGRSCGRHRMRSARPGATRSDRADVLVFDPTARTAASSRPESATASGSRSIRSPATCGAPPTSATASATTCRRTTSRACARARSTAGRGTTSARTRTRALKNERPDLEARSPRPTCCAAAFGVAADDVLRRARSSLPAIAATRSRPSTAHGTARPHRLQDRSASA